MLETANGNIILHCPNISHGGVTRFEFLCEKKRDRDHIFKTILGPGVEDNAGKSAIIVRALHKLKSVSASFRVHLAQCMHELGYEP